MKYNILFAISLILIISSCNNEQYWDDDKYVDVISEMRLAHAITNALDIQKRDSMIIVFKNDVYRLYDTNEEEYEANIKHLENDFKRGLDIENKVSTKLKNLKEEAKKLAQKAKEKAKAEKLEKTSQNQSQQIKRNIPRINKSLNTKGIR